VKILIISPTPTNPINAGNRARIHALSECLIAEGHDLHFVFSGMESGDCEAMALYFKGKFHFLPYHPPRSRKSLFSFLWRKLFGYFGIERAFCWKIDDWYDLAMSRYIKELHAENKFDIVIVEYVFLSKVLDFFDNKTLKVIDTHDIFGDRHKNYLLAGQTPEWFSTSVEDELIGLKRADVVIGIQEKESKYFRNYLPSNINVVTVGHHVSTEICCFNPSSFSAVFLGSSNKINVDAAIYFITQVLPLVRQAHPSFKFVLGGAVCDKVDDFAGVEKFARVDCIEDFYAKGLIAINPVQMGTGLNIKTIESLAFGMPLITTESGGRGLEKYQGKAFLSVANDKPQEMVDLVVALLLDKQKLVELSAASRKCIDAINHEQLNTLRVALLHRHGAASLLD
jgi:glycosyltransferase involved in cell wall biosynthesis